MDLHTSIKILFNKHYPGMDLNTLDSDLLSDMIEGIIKFEKERLGITDDDINQTKKQIDEDLDKTENKSEYFENSLIEQNYLLSNDLIPEMLVPSDLIYLNGKLNGCPIHILLDSGCQTTTAFKSTTDKAKLDYIIDKKSSTFCRGVGGLTKTYGMLWYTELEIETNPGKYVNIPIKLSVVDDTQKNNLENEIKDLDSVELIEQKNKPEILLGIDFMKTYKAIIDYNRKILTLNDSIVINYK